MSVGATVVVTYDGTDISNHVVFAESKFTVSAAAQPGRAQVRIKDMTQEMAFTTGREISLTVDGLKMWGGFVMAVDHIHAFPADNTSDPDNYPNRMFDLHCVDYNILFDKVVIRNPANYLINIPISGGYYDGPALKHILEDYTDLPGTYDTRLTSAGGLIESIVQLPADWAVEQGKYVRDILKTLSLDAAPIWYIDPAKRVRFQRLESAVHRWGFSDVPLKAPISWSPDDFQSGATYPFREITASEDGTSLVNDALVWGGSPLGSGGTTVFARATDQTSIDTRNRWQVGETYFNDDGLHGTQDGVDARADAIVFGPPGSDAYQQQKGYTNSQWQFHFRWFSHDVPYLDNGVDPPYRDHITVGELVTIEMQSFFGPSAPRLLPCRQIDISFLNLDETGKAIVAFDADFALNLEDPVKVWEFLRNKQSTIVAAPAAVAGDDTTVYGAYAQCIPTPSPNGSQTVFNTQFGYILTQLNVYLNGLLQRPGVDYFETDPTTGAFTMSSAPLSGESLYCVYRTLAS